MIEDRASLIDAVQNWLDDPNLESNVPTFIQLTESRLNRLLDDPDMEVISEATASGDYTALPDDFGEMVSITTGDGSLQAMGAVEFAGLDHSISGIPRYYSIVNRSISFAPSNTTAPITMVYRRRIPALTEANTSNWLLERAPDAYLYGCLVQAEGFNANDERITGWKAAFDEAIAELRIDATRRKFGAGPLAPRIRRA
jgi:hypothetical protein